MRKYESKVINSGNAVGKAVIIKGSLPQISRYDNCNSSEEISRLKLAADKVTGSLKSALQRARESGDESSVAVFDSLIMLLSDDTPESLVGRISAYIEINSVNAEFAIHAACVDIASEFAASDSEYLKARSEDILNLSESLIRALNDSCPGNINRISEPSIILTPTLSPEELSYLSGDNLLGIVTKESSPLSHTAIMARNMNIPFITGIDILDTGVTTGTIVAIDGAKAALIIEPGEDEVLALESDQGLEGRPWLKLWDIVNTCNLESGNHNTEIYANIGTPGDVTGGVSSKAAGIGLMRSEFLFMGRSTAPSEEEQFKAYVSVLDAMQGKPVIIRTLDVGEDKVLSFLPESDAALYKEDLRGIRFCFKYPELFKIQLRALLRAAFGRNLKIMFPMIRNPEELAKARRMVEETALELDKIKADYAMPSIGIMVETLEAVECIDKLASLADFFSIGSNDLTSLAFGIDRMSPDFAGKAAEHRDELIALIERTVIAAHRCGIKVGICGELAGDISLTEKLVNMGVDELSVAALRYFSEEF